MSKPSIPEGTRDFSPEQMFKRNYIFDSIKSVFRRYGFKQIETPTLEKLSTLIGKYGDEGDKLLFKVLNNGDFLTKANEEALQTRNSSKLVSSICDRGLRYDLTVPFARYVVMHQNDITFPFKRFQVQPVWRADRPQRGRYREFYQCDVDVVGSNSLLFEAELLQIYDTVFSDFKLPVTILINNRKILQGVAEAVGASDKFVDLTVAIDKFDKIGWSGVAEELRTRGFGEPAIEDVEKFLNITDLNELVPYFSRSEQLKFGVQEIQTALDFLKDYNFTNLVKFDLTLARGLNYYTGCIFEVRADTVKMGSIGGGGRYDDLTGVFGLKGVSGVGISFGADRIYDCLEELGLFPENANQQTQIMFATFDEECLSAAFSLATQLRKENLSIEVYPEATKIKKQLDYANKNNIPFVAIIGSEELNEKMLMLKNMVTGEQQKVQWSMVNDIMINLFSLTNNN